MLVLWNGNATRVIGSRVKSMTWCSIFVKRHLFQFVGDIVQQNWFEQSSHACWVFDCAIWTKDSIKLIKKSIKWCFDWVKDESIVRTLAIGKIRIWIFRPVPKLFHQWIHSVSRQLQALSQANWFKIEKNNFRIDADKGIRYLRQLRLFTWTRMETIDG